MTIRDRSDAQNERRATVRIDDAPSGKRFQGVWLEHKDGTRWVIDYRANTLWTWFADREVLVTGYCWQPDPRAQAINATHFKIETMRAANEQLGFQPYLSIGPERWLRGELITQSGAAGSKLAGSSWPMFVAEDGTSYPLANDKDPDRDGRVNVIARVVQPDMTYTSRQDGPDLWIVDVRSPDAEMPEQPVPGRCP